MSRDAMTPEYRSRRLGELPLRRFGSVDDVAYCAVVLAAEDAGYLTCHPFVSGRASRIALLEELVVYMRRFRGVWFTTCEDVGRWHAGKPLKVAAPPRKRALT